MLEAMTAKRMSKDEIKKTVVNMLQSVKPANQEVEAPINELTKTLGNGFMTTPEQFMTLSKYASQAEKAQKTSNGGYQPPPTFLIEDLNEPKYQTKDETAQALHDIKLMLWAQAALYETQN